jgi:hypothetical protein
MKRSDLCCFLVVLAIVVGVTLVVLVPIIAVVYGRSGALQTAVNVEQIRGHLEQLQSIATQHADRSAMTGESL